MNTRYDARASLLGPDAAAGNDRHSGGAGREHHATVADLERLLAAEPLVITQAQISRPKAKGDITLRGRGLLRRGTAAAGEAAQCRARRGLFQQRSALRPCCLRAAEAVPGSRRVRGATHRAADGAAGGFAKYSPDVDAHLHGRRSGAGRAAVLAADIKVIADVYDPARFATDPLYARHIGQLNVLTYLIDHRDSNVGNFLIGKAATGARVFSIDHGVAFASEDSDRGEAVESMRVDRLPADTVHACARSRLQMLRGAAWACWRNGGWRTAGTSRWRRAPNLGPNRGVRREGDDLQMGLTRSPRSRPCTDCSSVCWSRSIAGEITVVAVPNRGTHA